MKEAFHGFSKHGGALKLPKAEITISKYAGNTDLISSRKSFVIYLSKHGSQVIEDGLCSIKDVWLYMPQRLYPLTMMLNGS